MKAAVNFFLKNPIWVKVIVIFVFLMGISVIHKIPKEGFPRVSLNRILVTTFYPGASARDVELNVTNVIEDKMEEVSGIEEIRSTSSEGMSVVSLQVDEDADKDFFLDVYRDVEIALGNIDNLPAEIRGRPGLKTITSSDMPILEVAVNGELKTLSTFIPYLKRKLQEIKGVASIETIGFPDEELHILVDPDKAKDSWVDLNTIAQSIKMRNIEGSGGILETPGSDKKVVTFGQYKADDDVLKTIVRTNADGKAVYLSDLATVQRDFEDIRLKVRNNGADGVLLVIKKGNGSDIIKLVAQIQTVFKKVKFPAGISYSVLSDSSSLTRNRLSLAINNAIIGFVLVVLVLLLVFNLKTAFWTAFGIPFSLLGTYALFPLMDLSLDFLALGGFIIVLGMMVDDAIVVAEQVNCFREEGIEPTEASSRAVVRIWKAVLASSLTTILAFSPMLSLGGLPGKFVWIIPLVVVLVLSISLFDAFFLLPVHLAAGKSRTRPKRKVIILLEQFYGKWLKRALHYKWAVIAFFVILLGSCVLGMKGAKKVPFPQEAAEGVEVYVTMPAGTPLIETQKQVEQFEKIILKLPSQELMGLNVRIGTHSLDSWTEHGSQNNLVAMMVNLTPYSQRKRTASTILESLKAEMEAICRPEQDINLHLEIKRIGPPLGHSFEVNVSSFDENKIREYVGKIKKELAAIEGIEDIEDTDIQGEDEYNVVINYENLSTVGLSAQDVLLTLRSALLGQVVTEVNRVNKNMKYRLRLASQARQDLSFLERLPVLNRRGQAILLKDLITIKKQAARGSIQHLDGLRTIQVYGSVDERKTSAFAIWQKIKDRFPSGTDVEVSLGGQAIEGLKIYGGLGVAAIVAIISIFLVLSLMFNSFGQSLMIISIMPFIIIGIYFAIWAFGLPLSMLAMLGVIGLLGIVVNDSVVMVDTINHLHKEKGGNLTLDEVVNGAVSRLRPILLTSVTTILALFPTGYGIGGYDPFLSQMCLVLSYGLLFSTLILLFLLPCFFAVILQLKKT